MARSKHYLAATGLGTWPRHIITVDCSWTAAPSSATEGAQEETLAEYYASRIERDGERNRIVDASTGATTAAWWYWLRRQMESVGDITIIGYQCARQWALLGVWHEIDTGGVELRLDGDRRARRERDDVRTVRSDMRDALAPLSTGHMRRLSSRRVGMVVAQDPPDILRGYLSGTEAQVTWIDLRNHGIEMPRDVVRGDDGRVWIATAVQHMRAVADRYGLGSLKLTVGAQAMHAWRASYHHPRVYVHDHEAALLLESQAYYGGRCECYHIGALSQRVTLLDYRSMYPSICVDQRLPVRLVRHIDAPSESQWRAIAARGECIARVDVVTDEPAYPVTRDGITIYPVGEYTTSLCGPELLDALRRHRIRRCHEVSVYETEYCLRDYARAIYGMRCDAEGAGDDVVSSWAKGLLVCLPGKLGQLARGWEMVDDDVAPTRWGEWYGQDDHGEIARYRSVGGVVQVERTYGPADDACPAIAAWVTSCGRVKLLGAIRTAGWDHVYYCDTDSVMVDWVGLTRLQQSRMVADRVLGALGIKQSADNVMICAPKHYRINDRIVAAGIRRGVSEDAGDGVHYWHTPHPDGQIASGAMPTASRRLIRYDAASRYRHGVVADDGTVTPHRLSMGDM